MWMSDKMWTKVGCPTLACSTEKLHNELLTSYCSNSCSTVRMYTRVRCLLSLFSKMPRNRPNFPTTPASSSASLAADVSGSSSGFTFPPGIIHFCGRADDDTSSTSLSFESFDYAKMSTRNLYWKIFSGPCSWKIPIKPTLTHSFMREAQKGLKTTM